jgi:hypothetical protein
MSDNTLTLALEGDVTLKDFVYAMQHFHNLVNQLSGEVVEDANIQWEIETLQAGSATATIIGISQNHTDVVKVVDAYNTVGRHLERNEPIPFSSAVAREAEKITSLIDKQISSIRFQTADSDSIIYGKFDATRQGLPTKTISFGVVRGRVQTITERHSLKFALYDSIFDKSISCYVPEDKKYLMTEVWGQLVEVAGEITRSVEHGRATSLRRITDIEIIPEIKPGNYKLARGILPWAPEDDTPENNIRRIRDAQN